MKSPTPRSLMAKWFHSHVAKFPILFLKSRGYTIGEKHWIMPPVPSHSVSYEEAACIIFLCEYWGFSARLGNQHFPRSSKKLRSVITKFFGCTDMQPPLEFLRSRGYSVDADECITPPTPDHRPSAKENLCISFLVEEWDFDWVF